MPTGHVARAHQIVANAGIAEDSLGEAMGILAGAS